MNTAGSMTARWANLARGKWIVGAFVAVIVLTGGIELQMGRSLLGPNGQFGLCFYGDHSG
jgi:hypothetical protein